MWSGREHEAGSTGKGPGLQWAILRVHKYFVAMVVCAGSLRGVVTLLSLPSLQHGRQSKATLTDTPA